MGDVGDVHGDGPAVLVPLHPDRVVVVLGVGGVDRDDQAVAPVLAAGDFLGIDFLRHRAGFGDDVFRERGAQALAVDHRDDVDAGVAGPAEHFEDAAARVLLLVPLFEFDHDELPRGGGGFAGEVDLAVHRGVLGLDPAELALLLEDADDAAGAAVEDLFDLAAGIRFLLADRFAAGPPPGERAGEVKGNQHTVAFQCGAGFAARDVEAGVGLEVDAGGLVVGVDEVRVEPGVAARQEADGAAEQVAAGFSRFREFVATLLAFENLAFAGQRGEFRAEQRAVVGGEGEIAGNLGFVQRAVAITAHQAEQRAPQFLSIHIRGPWTAKPAVAMREPEKRLAGQGGGLD